MQTQSSGNEPPGRLFVDISHPESYTEARRIQHAIEKPEFKEELRSMENTALSQQSPAAAWWRRWEIIWLLALVLAAHVIRLESLPARGEESRRGVIAAEMLRTGSWFVARQQGLPNYSRPPLQYWAIAAIGWVRGECDIWAARLPSAFATLLTALVVYGYSCQFLSRTGALAAGAGFLTMGHILKLGGMAETEAVFTFFLSASLLVWHWGFVKGWSSYRMWMLAYTLVALGTLTKGTQAPVYFAGSVGVYLLLTGNWKRLFSLGHLAGIGIYAAVVGLWLVPFWTEAGFAAVQLVFSKEAATRFQAEDGMALAKHLILFPLEILGCMAPWSILLVAFAVRSFRESIREARPLVMFVLICAIVTFPTCWLAIEARSRYWMPMYPCLAPLIGLILQRCAEAGEGTLLRKLGCRFFLLCGLFLAGFVVFALIGSVTIEQLAQPAWLVGMLALAMTGFVVLLVRNRRLAGPRQVGTSVLVLSGSLVLIYATWFLNFLINQSLDHATAVAAVRQTIPNHKLVSFGQVNHLFLFYFHDPINRVDWPTAREDDIDYFCFDARKPTPDLPFAWEQVAVINCDRNLRPGSLNYVVIGRKVSETRTAEVRGQKSEE
jgi:4-amino-4-deoxy-L-arabinose transferase-like glycosyltransferase